MNMTYAGQEPMKPPQGCISLDDLESLQYPVGVTFKKDGIRIWNWQDDAYTGPGKLVPNRHVRTSIHSECPVGTDGEGMGSTKANFQETVSAIMSFKDETQKPDFRFVIFDYFGNDAIALGYVARLEWLRDNYTLPPFARILWPVICRTPDEVKEQYRLALENGDEGIIIRKLNGLYKFGRSNFREGWMLRIKEQDDTEAKVTGFQKLHHDHIFEKDGKWYAAFEDGRPMNDTKGQQIVVDKDGYEEALGTLEVKKGKVVYYPGSGFTRLQREQFWKDRKNLLGKTVTIRFTVSGTKDAPRHPVFKSFRNVKEY